MINELFDRQILIYTMGGLCIFGILIKFIVNFIYRRLISASDNMAVSNNKLVKLMRLKFEACYKLKIGVSNVDTFVDKYVCKHKFCGIHLYTWENIGGQVLMLCIAIGVIGAGLGFYFERGRNVILQTIFAGVVSSSLLIIVDSFFNIAAKKILIKINTKDYFENFLKIRLEQQYFTPELLEQYQKEYFTKTNKGKAEDPNLVVGEYKSKSNLNQEAAMMKEEELKDVQPFMESISSTAASSANADRRGRRSKKNPLIAPDKNLEEEKIIEDILKEYLA